MHIHRCGLGNVGETRSAQTSGSGVEGSDGGPSAGVRPPHAGGAGDPLRPAVVHRRARHAQVASRSRRPSWKAPSTRASASTARRSRASPGPSECDMIARPDPATFQVLPVSRTGVRRLAPGCSATSCMPDGSPSWADPRYVLRRALSKAAETGLHLLHPPRDRVLPAEGPARRTAASRRRSTPAATSTTPATTSRTTSAARPCSRWSASASRSSSATTRSRRASRRSTCATPTR